MASFRDSVLALVPSLYWPLDATYGATDQSGNGRNGTGVGSVSIGGHSATAPPFVGQGDGTCTDFDGTDDRVTSTYAPFTNATVRTWIGWGYRDTDTGDDALWGSTGDGDNLKLQANPPADTAQFTTFGGGSESDGWSGWSVTTWYFWALVFDEPGDTVSLYLNGSLVSSLAHPGTYFAGDGNFEVGMSGSSSYPFDGKQAHVAVFEFGLTSLQIADLYTAATTTPPAPDASGAYARDFTEHTFGPF